MKTLEDYVEENKDWLWNYVHDAVPNYNEAWIDNEELENWVLNDENLYNMALEAGVDFDLQITR